MMNVCIHQLFVCIAHHLINLKAIALNFGMELPFKNDLNLSRLTPLRCRREVCGMGRRDPSTTCAVGVVYDIPVTSGILGRVVIA